MPQARGIRCENGLSMLVAQAKRAAELFTGRDIPDAVCTDILRRMEAQMHNLILVGMPGSGKTTRRQPSGGVAGAPVLRRGRGDREKAGLLHSGLFCAERERRPSARSRREVLAELGKRSGCVIATGGGCVNARGKL